MKRLLIVLALVALAAPAFAQNAIVLPTTLKLGWDHDGINTDGYKLRVDAEAPVIVQATCEVTLPSNVRACTIPFPALTPGTHTLVVIAYNAGAEAPSDPFPVSVFIKPGTPTGLRLVEK